VQIVLLLKAQSRISMHNRTNILFLFIFSYIACQAQDGVLPNFWTPSSDVQFRSSTYQREIVPEKYLTFSLDNDAFEAHLNQVLPRNYTNRQDQTTTILLPNPSGYFTSQSIR